MSANVAVCQWCGDPMRPKTFGKGSFCNSCGALCEWCGRGMMRADGCSVEVYSDFTDGITRVRIPFLSPGEWKELGERSMDRCCGDCGVRPLHFHHPGCDLEQCPRCGGQAFVCGCRGNGGDAA
jgi:hypothetical protein